MANPLKSFVASVLPAPLLNNLRRRYETPAPVGEPLRQPAPHLPEDPLEASKHFTAAKASADGIEGMLSEFSMAAMDCLLGLQHAAGVAGHIVEFGVFKGRSAAILAHRARAEERFLLCDIAPYLEADKIAAIAPQMEFVLCGSEDFRSRFPRYGELSRQCRLIHIDSSHAYRTTINELSMCEELLSDHGIAVLDDFTNLNYSQILAATYKYLYTNPTDLAVFMVTEEKAYICRKGAFDYYARFVLREILTTMAARGLDNVCLSRTDRDPEYRAIYLRYRLPGETGPFYAPQIYGHHYVDP